jgi:hypothetical protein
MCKTFYCNLGGFKSFLELLLPAPDLGASHALLQLLPALAFIYVATHKINAKIF